MCVLRIAVLLIARVAAALGCCVVSVGYSLVVRGGEKQTKGLSPDGTPQSCALKRDHSVDGRLDEPVCGRLQQ